MKKILLFNGLITLALIICSGCASIVDGGRRKVALNSNPSGATVTVMDDSGQTVASGTTPTTVRLQRNEGYFRGQHYTVKFELAGYYPSQMEINSRLNPWYWGNFGFGGAIGLLAVDPLTGAMWTLSPRHIDRNLISTSENLTPDQLKAAEENANPSTSEVASKNTSKEMGKNSTQ